MTSIETLYQHFLQHPVIGTDSRKIEPGSLFFALKGEKFDGNQYAAQALADGAAFAIVDDPALAAHPQMLPVENVLTALQQLARHHRRTMQIPIIGIGGSNGKTTTKELVSAILSSHYACHFTKGNFNNHIGVPLTLLAMPKDTEVAVIEMGANHPGEIDELCRIAEPTHGLITNIGKEHLEGFGSLEGVKKAEGELFRYLAKKGGCAFVNASEKYLKTMARNNKRKVTYAAADTLHGLQETFVEVQLVHQTPFVEVAFLNEHNKPVTLQSKLFGRHNFHNIMSGIALGMYFKVPAAKIKAAIEEYTPKNNRSQIVYQNGNTIILDAYNANPSSMEAALESFELMEARQKVAILGDMLELGSESLKEHVAILRKAHKMQFHALVVVGREFEAAAPGQLGALHFPNADAARSWYRQQNFTDTMLLIKGSRGIKLETILDL
jgi:UDP-N-acetylmuramoyl-tripeptide--D-alanyl-D-alanine ligase